MVKLAPELLVNPPTFSKYPLTSTFKLLPVTICRPLALPLVSRVTWGDRTCAVQDAGRASATTLRRAHVARARFLGRRTPGEMDAALHANSAGAEYRNAAQRDSHPTLDVLRVAESKTKSGVGRPIPLTPPAWAALRHWADRFQERRPEHFVFPACENGQVDPSRGIVNWRTAWRRITGSIQCPACGETQNPGKKCRNVECGAKIPDIKNPLDRLRFHDLRHSTATKLLEQGTPIAVVAHILGCSASTAVRMAKRYGHIRPEAQRQALAGVATQEIQIAVHQFVHQPGRALQSSCLTE
jgi:hypothetical protein